MDQLETRRPVPDAPTATLVVAWNRHSTSRAVATFVRAAATVTSRRPVVPADLS